MALYPLSGFHEGLRAILGDEGDESGYDFVDAQLDAALRTVVRMGTVPCLALDAVENPDSLAAAPANADTWGFLLAHAARILLAAPAPESFRTRALSVRSDPRARADANERVETLIAELEARGNVCGAATDTGHQGLFSVETDVMTYVGWSPAPELPASAT